MEYQRHRQPGCGGCLFIVILVVLALGGAPLFFELLGVLLYGIVFLVLLWVAASIGAGYWFKKKVADYEASQSEAHNRFVFLLIHILINIAALDGEVSRAETETIYNFFRSRLGYGHSQMLWIKDLVRQALAAPMELDLLLSEFSGFSYEIRLVLVDLIYQVIYTKTPSAAELELADRIAQYLGISPYDHRAVHGRYAYQQHGGGGGSYGDDSARYYRILGLEPSATADEIKKAYRNLSKKYHPDMVASLGEEFRRAAEEKMKEINEAYARLKEKHGI